MARTKLVDMGRTNRQGTSTSSSTRIAADVGGLICVHLTFDSADFIDPGKVVRVRLYRFDPVLQQWVLRAAAEWAGAADGRDVTNPDDQFSMTVPAFDLRDQDVRVEVDVPVRMRIGCTIEHEPNT